jgi:Na+-transporting NADH:ubiquinone oxidoreductase subunit NqrD
MNAQEARSIATEKRKEPINRILDKIKKSAQGGNMSMFVYESLHREVVESLKNLGYKVTQLPDDPREPSSSTFEITWS